MSSTFKSRLVNNTDFSRFGIELAPEVVRADGNVRNLAWRICNAKRVLVGDLSNPNRVLKLIDYNRPLTACPGQMEQPPPSKGKSKLHALPVCFSLHSADIRASLYTLTY